MDFMDQFLYFNFYDQQMERDENVIQFSFQKKRIFACIPHKFSLNECVTSNHLKNSSAEKAKNRVEPSHKDKLTKIFVKQNKLTINCLEFSCGLIRKALRNCDFSLQSFISLFSGKLKKNVKNHRFSGDGIH